MAASQVPVVRARHRIISVVMRSDGVRRESHGRSSWPCGGSGLFMAALRALSAPLILATCGGILHHCQLYLTVEGLLLA